MPNECLDTVNERSTYPITVAFTDIDGVASIPDSATYRIDCESTRTVIQAATAISPLASSVTLTVTSEQNRIIRSRAKFEIRVVTVEWDDGDFHGTGQYRYKLLGLQGVVDVPSASVSPSASASPSV